MKIKFFHILIWIIFSVLVPLDGYGAQGDQKAGPDLMTLSPEKETNETLPPGVSSDWWSAVQKNIRESEYHVTWQDKTPLPDIKSAYQAPNRANNLRTYFTDDGVRVIPRTAEAPEWTWGMSLQGYGTKGDVRPVAKGVLVPSKNQMAYQRGEALTEWYVNDERGLEQGFTLKEPPGLQGGETESWIVLRLALHGSLKGTINASGDNIEFVTSGGDVALQYGGLHSFDAEGRELPTRFAMNEAGVDILVDTKGAVYPLTVDPLTSAPVWTAESDGADRRFGWSVTTAGDVNGDGYSDVIVGAPYYGWGRAFVYHGSSTGLSTSPDWEDW